VNNGNLKIRVSRNSGPIPDPLVQDIVERTIKQRCPEGYAGSSAGNGTVTRMYRVTSPHSRYPNAVGEKVGDRRDGRVVLRFKKGRQRAYLPKNLELVRLFECQPGEKGARRTTHCKVVRGRSPYLGHIGRQVRGL